MIKLIYYKELFYFLDQSGQMPLKLTRVMFRAKCSKLEGYICGTFTANRQWLEWIIINNNNGFLIRNNIQSIEYKIYVHSRRKTK